LLRSLTSNTLVANYIPIRTTSINSQMIYMNHHEPFQSLSSTASSHNSRLPATKKN
jgi:hypothetical protein